MDSTKEISSLKGGNWSSPINLITFSSDFMTTVSFGRNTYAPEAFRKKTIENINMIINQNKMFKGLIGSLQDVLLQLPEDLCQFHRFQYNNYMIVRQPQ